MITLTDELKTKLLAAQSSGEAAELEKKTGQEIAPEGAALLWKKSSIDPLPMAGRKL